MDSNVEKKDNRVWKLILVVIVLLLAIAGGYFLMSGNEENQETVLDTEEATPPAIDEVEIVIEQGDKLVWPSESVEFYLPKEWTYDISTGDIGMDVIRIQGDGLSLTMEYLPVPEGSLWSDQENTEYSTPTSRLFQEDGAYKAIFNMSISLIDENYETGEVSNQEYGLFLTIQKDGLEVDTLTDIELASLTFLLDSFDAENGY
jgi:hypothetical protein